MMWGDNVSVLFWRCAKSLAIEGVLSIGQRLFVMFAKIKCTADRASRRYGGKDCDVFPRQTHTGTEAEEFSPLFSPLDPLKQSRLSITAANKVKTPKLVLFRRVMMHMQS